MNLKHTSLIRLLRLNFLGKNLLKYCSLKRNKTVYNCRAFITKMETPNMALNRCKRIKFVKCNFPSDPKIYHYGFYSILVK